MRVYFYLFIVCVFFISCSNRTSSNKKENDIQRNESKILLDSAYNLIKLKDSLQFLKLNKKGLIASIEAKDTFNMADAYWNYGYYYLEKEVLDSAYFYYNLAYKNFSAVSHDFNAARMLFNLAIIQNNLKDYTGSEITTFQAISMFDKKKHHLNLYRCYNNLGILYLELNEFDKSIKSHNQALEHLKKVKKKRTFIEGSLNNIGLTYQKQGVHSEAINYFNRALESDSLINKNPSLYAKLIDNRGYNKLQLRDTVGIFKDFQKALKIRDSLRFISGVVINKLHISEYFTYKKDTTKAVVLMEEAYSLAKSVDNHRDMFAALKALTKYDIDNTNIYLNTYVSLNDSLQKEERKIRNKFTRIKYETDEYIEKAEKLTTEKQLVIIIGLIAVLLLSSIIFIIRQRSKTKQLMLEKEQQKGKEKIYSLMLEHQSKLEEGKIEERIRISEELHDNILGSMYGIRMKLGFLELDKSKEIKNKFKKYLNELSNTEKEIRNVSHQLQSNFHQGESNFIQSIKSYLNDNNIDKSINITVNSKFEINWNNINPQFKVDVFRIIQEAFMNILKHSNATKLQVLFSQPEGALQLEIIDNGQGFNFSNSKPGIGLENMTKRVERLGGTIKIESILNVGTKVIVTLDRSKLD